MAKKETQQTVHYKMDGRSATAPLGEPLIKSARRLGIDIPSLCDHEELLPYGACRMCLVEVSSRGRPKLVTACTYPAEEGISVLTSTPAIEKHRRLIAEVLLSRSGSVPFIAALAAKMGVTESRFGTGSETCIMCGLCTRVCETYATSAISTLQRGDRKQIGPPGDFPVDCIGCGACAAICPTGHISFTREGGTHTIWNREFKIPVAVVDNTRCHQCGICASRCPFSIPRAVVTRDGQGFTEIKADVCRGCGVCVAACPSGAISQPRFLPEVPDLPSSEEASVWVLGCGRTNIGRRTSPPLPPGFVFTEVPCTGAITLQLLLGGLLGGFSRILVLGRHQETCHLKGAENHARNVVKRADELAVLAGCGESLIVFAELPPGNDQTVPFLSEFGKAAAAVNRPSQPKEENNSRPIGGEVMETLRRLSFRGSTSPWDTSWLKRHDLPVAKPGEPVLLSGELPYLNTIFGEYLTPLSLEAALRDCLGALESFGIRAGIWLDGIGEGQATLPAEFSTSAIFCTAVDNQQTNVGPATALTSFLLDRMNDFASRDIEKPIAFTRGNESHRRIIQALGYQPVPVDRLPACESLHTLKPPQKLAIINRFVQAMNAGAVFLVVSDPRELCFHFLASRTGSWQRSLVKPILLASLVQATLAERRVER